MSTIDSDENIAVRDGNPAQHRQRPARATGPVSGAQDQTPFMWRTLGC